MNKFDSHVILFEKWILNVSMAHVGFLKKENVVDVVIQASRPFLNYRLLEFLKDKDFKGDFYDFNNEFRRRKKDHIIRRF